MTTGLPSSPSAGGDATTPVDSPAADCKKCCPEDHEKAISVNSHGRYFHKYQANGSLYNYNFPIRYKIVVPLKTGSHIIVEVRFKPEAQAGVDAAAVEAAKAKLLAGVAARWNGRYSMTITDPECASITLPVKYKVIWVDSGEDYTIKIHRTYPREGVTGPVMDVSASTSDWTYSHEFAHCVGTPDEYSYSNQNETVRYLKPDGTEDAPISVPPNSKPASDPTATIMSTVNNTTTLQRHGWPIAIEVQELLRSALGRAIKCDVS